MTDGAFRRDGTLVPLPAPDTAGLEALWRRSVLAEPDRSDGPYAGVHRMTALEFLARLVDHVPERDEVREG